MHRNIRGTEDWCLANDTFISEYCDRAQSLIWDAPLTQLPLWPLLPARLSVIDVGAYIGDTTRFFLEQGHSVIAFEPQEDAFECLVHNCPTAISLPLAVGNGEKIRRQKVGGGNLGGRAVFADETGEPTVRLDDLKIPRLDLLKIDAEGSETRVLEGAKKIIERHLPIILLEINEPGLQAQGSDAQEVLKLLKGYQSVEYYRYGKHQWDLVMWHPNSLWQSYFSWTRSPRRRLSRWWNDRMKMFDMATKRYHFDH